MKKFLMSLFLIMSALNLTACSVVEDGQVGVKHTLGKIDDQPLGSGLHFVLPIFQHIEKWNVKKQEIKETANVPSSEGLMSTLDVSVIYRYTTESVTKIRKTIGTSPIETILQPYTRDAIRSVASGYPVKALYSEVGRNEIADKLESHLTEKLSDKGIDIEEVLLRDIKLPQAFTMSIEAKMKAEQESLQKEFDLIKAKKDAEIEVAKAEGVAEANKIISSSITPEYLRYKFIEQLNDANTDIIYVPTEANLPILEAARN